MTGPAAQSLQPPVSANQLGEIQTVMWLVFPAWRPQSREGSLGTSVTLGTLEAGAANIPPKQGLCFLVAVEQVAPREVFW